MHGFARFPFGIQAVPFARALCRFPPKHAVAHVAKLFRRFDERTDGNIRCDHNAVVILLVRGDRLIDNGIYRAFHQRIVIRLVFQAIRHITDIFHPRMFFGRASVGREFVANRSPFEIFV